MPHASSIDVSRRLIISRIWGELTSEAIVAQRREIGRDQRFEPTFRHLVFLDITASAMSMDEIGRLADSSIFEARAPRAFVARTDLAFSFLQMYGAYAYLRGYEIALFRTDGEAAAYLEVEAAFVASMRQQLTGVTPAPGEPSVTDVRRAAPAGRTTAASEWASLKRQLLRMRASRAPRHDATSEAERATFPRARDAAPHLGDDRLEVSLVPRLGVPVERWTQAPEESRLRLVTRTEVRYVDPAPPGWESMPPERLERLWEDAEPA